MSNKKNKKGDGKLKSRQQVNNYKQFLSDSKSASESTVFTSSSRNLESSDQLRCPPGYIDNIDEPIAPKKPKYIVADWLRKNIWAVILGPLLVGYVLWVSGAIIGTGQDIAVLKVQIDSLIAQTEKLDIDAAKKETIKLELLGVKDELSNKFEISFSDMKHQIDLLERQIQFYNNLQTGSSELNQTQGR